jgi:hypothetical protein
MPNLKILFEEYTNVEKEHHFLHEWDLKLVYNLSAEEPGVVVSWVVV